jgi:hypothetical protein
MFNPSKTGDSKIYESWTHQVRRRITETWVCYLVYITQLVSMRRRPNRICLDTHKHMLA